MQRRDDRPAPRWTHEPLEESLDGAGPLTVSIVDRMVRAGWQRVALDAGVPPRRLRRYPPVGDAPVVAIVDGRPALDAAAWSRLVSLVPGAVALPRRTAAAMGVATRELQPPGRPPARLLDLVRARRARARLRRMERTLPADMATLAGRLEHLLELALAPGDDGTPFTELPAYALAARLEGLVADASRWSALPRVDLATGHATARLLRLLVARGRAPGAALIEVAGRSSGGGLALPRHLESLRQVAEAPADERDRCFSQWLEGRAGWHAMRDLHLEATPLRRTPDKARRWLDALAEGRADQPGAGGFGMEEADRELHEASQRLRRLVALREQAARLRTELHAALRALAWTLAERLEATGQLPRAEAAFDLDVEDLLRIARGGSARDGDPQGERLRGAPPPDVRQGAPTSSQLRGIPASGGVASGRVVVVHDPTPDEPVAGAVLVCRSTDPAWLPLMMQCVALVTERGGPLSHAAIVARELGLPAVVGVAGATATAELSQAAHVDGGSGMVSFQQEE